MLVAQVVPSRPSRSGRHGAEWVAGKLREGLTARGHEVVELQPPVDAGGLSEFDVVHAHADDLASPAALSWTAPSVHTLHGPLGHPTWRRQFSALPGLPLVSIADHQRRPLEGIPVRWLATIHDGTDLDEFPLVETSGSYLAFVGGMGPDEGAEEALEIAEVTGVPLKIAAREDPSGQDYWSDVLAPLLRSARVEYVGTISGPDKAEFLGGALATLFPTVPANPSTRPMVESLASGTPVITISGGSGPEVVEDGVSGFVADSLSGMCRSVDEVGWLDRRACRRRAARFGTEPMVERYELVYRRLIGTSRHRKIRPVVRGPMLQPVTAAVNR